MASAKEFLAKHGLAIGSPSTIVFNSSGVLQASALSGATISITSVDIDGGTDIGADLVDADLLLVDDGAGGTKLNSSEDFLTPWLKFILNFFGIEKVDIVSADQMALDYEKSIKDAEAQIENLFKD